jgi:hypothetical protein
MGLIFLEAKIHLQNVDITAGRKLHLNQELRNSSVNFLGSRRQIGYAKVVERMNCHNI